jgi:hypothetical protein
VALLIDITQLCLLQIFITKSLQSDIFIIVAPSQLLNADICKSNTSVLTKTNQSLQKYQYNVKVIIHSMRFYQSWIDLSGEGS